MVEATTLSVSMVTSSTISIISALSISEVLPSDEKMILLLSPNLEGEQEPYLSLLSTLALLSVVRGVSTSSEVRSVLTPLDLNSAPVMELSVLFVIFISSNTSRGSIIS